MDNKAIKKTRKSDEQIVLGISALYHDSAAAIIRNGEIIACAQEERFTRKKHDNSLPVNAINYCMKEAGVIITQVDYIVYYDNPLLTLDRYIHNVMALRENAKYLIDTKLENVVCNSLAIDRLIKEKFGVIGKANKLLTCEHHISHAASAFYPSPFQSAAILTIDGVGEWATTTIGYGNGKKIEIIEEIDYPHSLGLLYSAFTAFCGFKVNSGEYKFMGLAPYGEPAYYDLLKKEIIDIKPDGSYRLNLEYFDFYKGKYMTNDKFADLFGESAREMESKTTRREMNIAASVQKLTEEIIILLSKHAKEITGEKNLVLAGGVALNCVANGKLLKEKVFDKIWIQPAAGDAGGALGCALYAYYNYSGGAKRTAGKKDLLKGSYLGPGFDSVEIKSYLDKNRLCYEEYKNKDTLYKIIAKALSMQKVVGWFQGRMEFGPRALGNRSILADARSEKMQSKLNLKIKYRESFRPFAPSVLREKADDFFELEDESPYMLFVAPVKEDRLLKFDKNELLQRHHDDMLPLVSVKRSDIPAITHVDYSARIQTVSEETNYDYYHLLLEFEKITGYGVIINTSFNVRGEPIVCTPEDAYRCFMRTEMDILVLENYILYKENQPQYEDKEDWRDTYELD